TPHQTPLRLSSQPIARSIEKRPGPIAARDAATVARTSGYSRPPFPFQKPFDQCTVQIALNITTAIASDASGVTNPAASRIPLDSERPAAIAISTGARNPSWPKKPPVPFGP